MKNDYKILFVDLDGTLLNDDKTISNGNRRAIDRVLESGNKVVVTTGRPFMSAVIHAQKLGLSSDGCYMISFNGGSIYDFSQQKEIYHVSIPKQWVRYMFDIAKEKNIYCHTYTDDEIICEMYSAEFEMYRKNSGSKARVVKNILDELKSDPVKMVLMDLFGKDRLIEFRNSVQHWVDGKLDSVFSSDDMLEYLPLNTSKGNGLEFLCDYLNIPIENTVAVGDAENDISMIKKANVGIAMLNGNECVKKCADYITTRDNNHDAIEEIVDKFKLYC